MNAADRSSSDEHPTRDPLDKGLAEAFGERAQAKLPHTSVLQALQQRTKSKLGVHIESQGLEDAPVKVTDEVRALRDPSGRYQMLGEIGRGGMGVVYKGRDQDLGRDVAMKVLKDEYATRADVLARFVEEAQIGGQLQHPGIVPVYELGLQSGERPYFAMKLVKGETLAAQLAKRSDAAQDRRRLLGIFEQVCQTIAYAHARHVVHRDLKPANVMIGAFGEVQVVDWGFAKVLQKGAIDATAASKRVEQLSVIDTTRSRADSGSHSVAGSMMGTPAYMPPEQALGDIARVDERSDVFALGAILCELLTGDAPYREEDGDLVRQAANAQLDGAHERLAKCGADEALVALCKECLAPSQRARPASGAEVAERVSAYLTSVEERARQAEVRAAEARLRHRVTLTSAGAGVLVLALTAGGWMWLGSQARARRTEATQRVASAMSTASGARGRAQSAGLDPSLWSTAVSSAEQLVSLAKSDGVDAKVRADAEALLATVQGEVRAAQAESERHERDKAMLAELETARIPADEDVRYAAIKELRRLDAAYHRAFSTYLDGASLLEQPAESTLASLRRGAIPFELAGSLDHWGLVRDALSKDTDAPDPAGTARIREIAAALDAGDAWRTQLRALLPNAATESARLRELAEHADFSTLTAVGCRVLSQALWSAGEQDASVMVAGRAQELHPRDFEICFHLGLALDLFDKPRTEEALAAYRIAHAIRPEQKEVLHREIMALQALERFADGERIARQLLQHDSENAHWHLHLGMAIAKQGRPDEAIASFRRTLELDPRSDPAYRELGSALADQGKLDDAVVSYRRALEIVPEDFEALVNLSWVFVQQGEEEEAIECCRRALKINPQEALAHMNLGAALGNSGKRDEAIASLRRAIELNPRLAEAHMNLGMHLHTQGKLDEAIASLRRALEINPRLVLAHARLGDTLWDQGKQEEAIACLERALEIDPRSVLTLTILGKLLHRQGKLDEAIANLQRAVEIDPQAEEAHRRLGLAFHEQNRFAESASSYRRALELAPRSAENCNGLGLALMNLDDLDEAIASYRRALEIDPRCAPAYMNLSIALSLEEKLDEALAACRKAEEFFAQDSSAFGRQWRATARAGIEDLEHRIELLPAVDEVLDGRRATSSAEWNRAIVRGYEQRRLGAVVALTEHTLRDAPELIDDVRGLYNSACAAALFAAGSDSDVSQDERARVRELARVWLDGELERWITQQDQAGAKAEVARDNLAHALDDADLANVRGTAIDALPEGERAAWRSLWKRIEDGAAR